MLVIKSEDIVDEEYCCVYCGTAIGTEFAYVGCCGEVHGATFYILADGSMVEENECIVEESIKEFDKYGE